MKKFEKYTTVLGVNRTVAVLVDDGYALLLEQKQWHFAYNRNKKLFVVVLGVGPKKIKKTLQHIVLCGSDKCPRGCVVNHINGDTTDNRKSNLKKIDFASCQAMRANRTDTKSGYRGVYYRDANKKRPWVAVVKCEGSRQHLGAYSTKEEAARVVDDFRREIYGDNIPLNFKK